jgi:hypothetical protein
MASAGSPPRLEGFAFGYGVAFADDAKVRLTSDQPAQTLPRDGLIVNDESGERRGRHGMTTSAVATAAGMSSTARVPQVASGPMVRLKNLTFRLGVNNVFDKSPPRVGAGEIGNGIFGENNTYPQIYDSLGRFIHMSLTAKF